MKEVNLGFKDINGDDYFCWGILCGFTQKF